MQRSSTSTRDRRLAKAKTLYPDAFKRVRAACQWAPENFDLDDHAARIVLAAKEARA